MSIIVSTQTEWLRRGNEWFPGTRADKSETLDSGIYRYASPPQEPWRLVRVSDNFEFPFKVYNASGHIIKRVYTHWSKNSGNLGVLLNGRQGAGKTMTAQILANLLIEKQKLPVLVVRSPIPLQLIFDSVQQDMIVIFDEFEKTHDETLIPGCQQALLSTIDGMSRSTHKRLIIFTTNKTVINENFVDRPSRIHYKFEFRRVADEIIEGLITDCLSEELIKQFKPQIFEYLNTRKICTIDIVKAVIAEVRTFEEAPTDFEDMLNVAKGNPPAYTIQIIDDKGNPGDVFSTYFKPGPSYSSYNSYLSGNKRSIQQFVSNRQHVSIYSKTYDGNYCIVLLEKCEEDGCWLAQLGVPRSKTPFSDFPFLRNTLLFLDNQPEDWNFPHAPEIVRRNAEARTALQELYNESISNGTVFGTGERAVFKIHIEANNDTLAPSLWKVTGTSGHWSDDL